MRLYCYLSTYTLIAGVLVGTLAAETSGTAETVTLSTALRRAIQSDPGLELNTALADAAEGQIEQADLPPNPVLGAEAENFLGTGPVTGVQGLEITVGISQVIETAGKQARRTTLARRERQLVDWQREVMLSELEAEIHADFVDVLLAQQFVELSREQLELAEQSEREVIRLVDAARSSQVELTRARLAVRQQRYALEQARRNLAAAKTTLAMRWGTDSGTDFVVEGSVRIEPELPVFSDLAAQLVNTAQLGQYEAFRNRGEAALELEKAQAVPDFEVFAGGRYFNEDNGNYGFVAGIEVPLPVFDRNQGNIRSTRAQLRAVDYEREARRRELLIQLNRAYQSLTSAHADAASVREQLMPGAEQAVADVSAGYERGQYTQLDLLASQEALFDIRAAYLDALQRYATAQTEIRALTRPVHLSR